MIAKVLRRLGLGHAAYRLAAPVYSGLWPDCMEIQAARELLLSVSRNPANSCYLPKGRYSGEEKGKDLDIIIPAYNAENYIDKCLNSVLSQKTKYSFRVLVIDDGSTDATGKILDGYSGISVIHQENRGFSGARNAGLDRAEADYLLFLDSDDELCPGAVEALMSRAKELDCAIVEGAYTEVTLNGGVLRRHGHPEGLMEATELEGFACGKVIKRSLFNNLSFPLDYWYEDSIVRQVILPMIRVQNLIAAGISESVFLYRRNPKGITRSSRGHGKSLDSLYITMQLFEDRKKFGLNITADYYDYILSMAVQTYSRTKKLGDEISRAIFTVYADFIEKEFSGWATEDRKLACLEKALRERDFGRYLAYCALH